jgi:hypothetical protein
VKLVFYLLKVVSLLVYSLDLEEHFGRHFVLLPVREKWNGTSIFVRREINVFTVLMALFAPCSLKK